MSAWALSPDVALRNDRLPDADADRQQRTAAELLMRLGERPGVVLADEVGMGKTYVALAVAVSALQATRKRQPVVVMVPPAVADKWPTEWAVFAERCLAPGHGLRASRPVRRGSEFLKLLDDPPATRPHLIFLTHGALTSNLHDPFIRLALVRRAMLWQAGAASRRKAVARSASRLLGDGRFDEATAQALLDAPLRTWRAVWDKHNPSVPLDDDPVPEALMPALDGVDLVPLRQALAKVPVNHTASFEARLQAARGLLRRALDEVWTDSLGGLDIHLPLLVLDEAHHVKNPNQLARLFANEEAERDAEALQGPLGNMFDKMLFLTATPFQLGHQELLRVLGRFSGVRWPAASARKRFEDDLAQLQAALDQAQASALRFEHAWTRIAAQDAQEAAALTSFDATSTASPAVITALDIGATARDAVVAAQALLRPWVVRHVRADAARRRNYRPGRTILQPDEDEADGRGLPVGGPATLPFLLATRAQAVASLHGSTGTASTRSYYAYGLASSFEAYADTRRNRTVQMEDVEDGGGAAAPDPPSQLSWYLDRISAALPEDAAAGWAEHPKVAATVDKVRALWLQGEKVLVFCFYVETGRALRSHVSRALRTEIIERAAGALGLDPMDEVAVLASLERTAERLLRSDSAGYVEFRSQVRNLAAGLDEDTQDRLIDVVTRFMRTPSFLVRFVDLSPKTSVADLIAGLDRSGGSGTSLATRIRAFAVSLGEKVSVEREELLAALTSIQTGDITGVDDAFDPSERARSRETLLPNVRLANGGVRQETRRRLMLTFNTPFFPEVLVASSVMAEGVDLHQDCRHVIHHDLDWNPSTLEQRTGRIDRIGSKAQMSGRPVMVYEPYVGGTHDEKMFRVVKDRERWFGIVMGGSADTTEWGSERQAARVPLPQALADALRMDLSTGPSTDALLRGWLSAVRG